MAGGGDGVRFLIHSNGPTVSTGYGVQTANLTRRLVAAGHEVAVSVTYGQQGAVGAWQTGVMDDVGNEIKVRLYPVGYETNSNDVLHLHASHWFSDGREPHPDIDKDGWIVPLLDVWCLVNPRLCDFRMAAWTPIDHSPVPPGVIQFFVRNPEAVPIAMSRFGERELFAAGLNPAYVPLSVDTSKYRPSEVFVHPHLGDIPVRKVFDLPDDAFVVGMVAMNKGWARDRKGFNEAFRAFAQVRRNHSDAILFLHTEKWGGAEGLNLIDLANTCGIPEHAIRWTDQYAYRIGLPPEMMAAAYNSMDVLLAPSHGEGFCVPLIEAQACGTAVIATDFSSQSELVGAGWLVKGQPEWDPAQKANYVCPSIGEIVRCLEECYSLPLEERRAMSVEAYRFGQGYDCDVVFDAYWLPLLERLEKIQAGSDGLTLAEPRSRMESVDIIVPLMREQNKERFWRSLHSSGEWIDVSSFGDADPQLLRGSVPAASVLIGEEGKTFAENVNSLYARSRADWMLIVGDDVEFKPGWFEAAQAVSDRFDVIGTNDTAGRVRNPDVAAGRHADHFFVRRAYIEEHGACLDGPGVLAPEAYGHWYTDKEIVELAKARKVFGMAMDSVIVHHHPGYDGDEAARQADPVYMVAVERAAADRDTWLSRVPLIQMQRA